MKYGSETKMRISAHRGGAFGRTLAAGLLIIGATTGAALAQTAPKAAPKAPAAAAPAAPAPAAAAASGAKPTYWVRLCEKTQVPVPDKDGKVTPQDKNICLTHHERLDGTSGMVIVSSALRQVEGSDKQHLMVMVPIQIGIAIPPGLRAAVYTKELWAKFEANEKYDDKLLKPVEMKYTICHVTGCTAEIEATKELIESLKTGGGMVILALNGAAQPVLFPIPLDGFAQAQAGPPANNAQYSQERARFFQELRGRQEEAYKQYVEQQKTQDRLAPKPGELAPAPLAPAPVAPAPVAKKP